MASELHLPPRTLYRRLATRAKSSRILYQVFKHLHVIRQLEVASIRARARVAETDVLCDVGCGDGYWTSRIGQTARIAIGLDPYRDDLKKASRHTSSQMQFVNAVAESIPLADSSVDKVVSVCVFEHCFDDRRAFAEAHRILRPGGTLVATVDSLNSPHISDAHREYHRVACYVHQLYDIDSIRSKLLGAGFRSVEAHYIFGSRLAIWWEVLLSRYGGIVNLLSPVVFPMLYLTERHQRTCGYKILVVARK